MNVLVEKSRKDGIAIATHGLSPTEPKGSSRGPAAGGCDFLTDGLEIRMNQNEHRVYCCTLVS